MLVDVEKEGSYLPTLERATGTLADGARLVSLHGDGDDDVGDGEVADETGRTPSQWPWVIWPYQQPSSYRSRPIQTNSCSPPVQGLNGEPIIGAIIGRYSVLIDQSDLTDNRMPFALECSRTITNRARTTCMLPNMYKHGLCAPVGLV